MEQGAGIVGRQQRGLAVSSLGEVADIDDQGRDVAVELLLVAQRGHPGAGVAITQRLVLTRTVLDLPDPYVRMPDRNILALSEADAEKARRAVESGLDHVVEGEIGLDR